MIFSISHMPCISFTTHAPICKSIKKSYHIRKKSHILERRYSCFIVSHMETFRINLRMLSLRLNIVTFRKEYLINGFIRLEDN